MMFREEPRLAAPPLLDAAFLDTGGADVPGSAPLPGERPAACTRPAQR